jgi:type III restriction enzyme
MFQLKGYQQRAVDVLQSFLSKCLDNDIEDAYRLALEEQELPGFEYKDYGFEQVPYVCLRIPTGGGKTVLGSYAIDVAAKSLLDTETPMTLWLVPSITIRLQTVEALKKPSHPYRKKLDEAFKRQVLVLDIDEVTQIRPQDLQSKAIVIVSTLANLRVSDTSGRKIYAYHENFEPHFAKIPANHPSMDRLEKVSEDDVQENGLSTSEVGKIKYSFANLLAVYRPILIVDEAHNARTLLTFETLQRVHPAAIIELTATPNTSKNNGSNVLFHVSAAELKAEEMIKLPVMLTEHQNWQDAIQDAVITRKKLAIEAQKDEDYIRPIVLFQAENKNGDITVDVLKTHLIEQLKIDEDKIAVVTGKQRELDNLDLFSPSCKVEYIITIEALKEGWDCSFAYVFCSVKQVSSSKDAEQLLGRVLRMPYAKRRLIEDLNRAYAHLSTSKFSKAAQELADTLIAMGFEEMEVAAFLRETTPGIHNPDQQDLFDDDGNRVLPQPLQKTVIVETETPPDFSSLNDEEKKQITMSNDPETNTTVVKVTGEISESLEKVLSKHVKSGKNTAAFKQNIRIHNQSLEAAKAPSEKGVSFGSLPYLCMQDQGELDLIESEVFLHAHGWSLLSYLAELKNFSLHETSNSFSIDIDGKEIVYGISKQQEAIAFNEVIQDVSEQDLIGWLDRELKQPDIIQSQLIAFLSRIVKNLLQQPNMTLTALVRNKFPLARAIRDLIRLYRRQAQKSAYQETLFGNESNICLSDQFMYEFNPSNYPSRPPYYSGKYKFQKHYFPLNLIEDLKSSGEEYECAKMIDSLSEVKFWIRNLVRRDQASFWLPLAHNKFYPDFVCELEDGRMLVVEYKGEAYVSNDDSAEKRMVGELWANLSGGKCLFIMSVEQDKDGRDVRQQILNLISR